MPRRSPYACPGRREFKHWRLGADDLFFVLTLEGGGEALKRHRALLDASLSGQAHGMTRMLAVYPNGAGGQIQQSPLLDLDAESDRIQVALSYAQKHLAAPLKVGELAAAVHLSVRHFSRILRAATGLSPAKVVEGLRLEAARVLLEQSRQSIGVIAAETGFGDQERMRRAFVRAFGQSPQSLRRLARLAGSSSPPRP
jgi:transcriptional regulator GlxA family with amidase domain